MGIFTLDKLYFISYFKSMSHRKDYLTIYDIARYANVSASTVSRVLNGKKNVNIKTRLKVQKIIDQYNFKPNAIARALYGRESKTIGVLVQALKNPFYVKICHELEVYAREQGYIILLGVTNFEDELEKIMMYEFEKRQVDGLIFIGGRVNSSILPEAIKNEIIQVANRLPVAFINGNNCLRNCHCVLTDEYEAFCRLTRYVIDCNHKVISLVTGHAGVKTTELKIKAFKDTMEANNLDVDESMIISGMYTIESGRESAGKILGFSKKPTAILCANDVLAAGVITRLQQEGYHVPLDFSVAGFDDTDIAGNMQPGITTMGQNYKELSARALDMVIHSIKTGSREAKINLLDAELIIRQSCRSL